MKTHGLQHISIGVNRVMRRLLVHAGQPVVDYLTNSGMPWTKERSLFVDKIDHLKVTICTSQSI